MENFSTKQAQANTCFQVATAMCVLLLRTPAASLNMQRCQGRSVSSRRMGWVNPVVPHGQATHSVPCPPAWSEPNIRTLAAAPADALSASAGSQRSLAFSKGATKVWASAPCPALTSWEPATAEFCSWAAGVEGLIYGGSLGIAPATASEGTHIPARWLPMEGYGMDMTLHKFFPAPLKQLSTHAL